MKKRICLLLCVLLCAAAAFGCASTATTAPATTAAATLPAAVQTAQANAQTVNCTVAIDCKSAVDAGNQVAKQVSQEGVILAAAPTTVSEGESVLDALQRACDAAGVLIAVSGSGDGAYVTTIHSLSGGDCGDMSGWLYSVNGEFAAESCGALQVREGDAILFVYTVDGGADIGLTFE